MQLTDHALEGLLEKADGNPKAMLHIARTMIEMGGTAMAHRAIDVAMQVLDTPSLDAASARAARTIVNDKVARWHFPMMADAARNDAYEAALRRAISPGDKVLEIGTGSGLLAMMAARAGAGEVISCEDNPAIARVARDIIALNGYSDRVRIIAKHSDELDLDADLGGRADILVSEILGKQLLDESVLPAHEHAVRDLLKPGGTVIPRSGAVRAALADNLRLERHEVGMESGFDLSPFNAFSRTRIDFQVGSPHLALRSEPFDLFAFDLASAEPRPAESATYTCRSSGGRVGGVAQWIAIDLDAETRYENYPVDGGYSGWAMVYHPFDEAIETAAGQEIRIAASHDRATVAIWREE